MWCGAIDAEKGVLADPDAPKPPGMNTRHNRRSLGSANLLYDTVTIRTLQVLSAVTGEPSYAAAGKAYIKDYLAATQHPTTGLMAWGEHMHYDLAKDAVTGDVHEFNGDTAPWDLVWEADPVAASKAIAALRNHFYGDPPDKDGWYYNRHAGWAGGGPHADKHNGQMTWIRHSGSYAHAYAFLYAKTKEPQWLAMAKNSGLLFWNHRDPNTGIAGSCLRGTCEVEPITWAAIANHGSFYCILGQAGALLPEDPALRDAAVAMLKTYDRYGWDEQTKTYAQALKPDGTRMPMQRWSRSDPAEGLLKLGLAATFLARLTKDPDCLRIAQRCGDAVHGIQRNELSIDPLGGMLTVYLNLFDLTKDPMWLTRSHAVAAQILAKHLHKGLITTLPGGTIYEAQTGPGLAAAGLLRLRTHPELKDPGIWDWNP